MEYLYYDLGYAKLGQSVKVEIEGTECNVILVNNTNFINYKNSRAFNYYGGHTKSFPVILSIPFYDHWYVVVDQGNVKVNVSMTD